jgi:hypothetical protein
LQKKTIIVKNKLAPEYKIYQSLTSSQPTTFWQRVQLIGPETPSFSPPRGKGNAAIELLPAFNNKHTKKNCKMGVRSKW